MPIICVYLRECSSTYHLVPCTRIIVMLFIHGERRHERVDNNRSIDLNSKHLTCGCRLHIFASKPIFCWTGNTPHMWDHYKDMSYGRHVLRPWKLSHIANKTCKFSCLHIHIFYHWWHAMWWPRFIRWFCIMWTTLVMSGLSCVNLVVIRGEFRNPQLVSCHLNCWCSR